MRAEEVIEKEACSKALKAGWLNRKVQWIGRNGAPDRVFFGHGRCVFIEFKDPTQEPKGQQARELERLKKAYPEVYVCDSVEGALSILGVNL